MYANVFPSVFCCCGNLPLFLRSFLFLFFAFHSFRFNCIYDKYRYINLFIGCIYIGYINVSITLKRDVIDNPSSSSTCFTLRVQSSEFFEENNTQLSERVCFSFSFCLVLFCLCFTVTQMFFACRFLAFTPNREGTRRGGFRKSNIIYTRRRRK